MVQHRSLVRNAAYLVVGPIAAYLAFVLCLTNPWVQKQAVYAHKVQTTRWYDLNNPESFGFGKNQATPITIPTHDGEHLYAWHILPRALYATHAADLANQTPSPKSIPFNETLSYKLLASDPESRLIIYFHGNAGHILQSHRAAIASSLTTLHPKAHVLLFSYRGFGLSTGAPSEPGLIADGLAAVSFAAHALGVARARTALVAQSLGTAVASAVVAAVHDPVHGSVHDPFHGSVHDSAHERGFFATVVLVAGFPTLPDLVLEYRIGGVVPILRPLARVGAVQRWLAGFVRERWDAAGRLEGVVRGVVGGGEGGGATGKRKGEVLDLRFVHARDDADVPWWMSVVGFRRVVGALRGEGVGSGEDVVDSGDIGPVDEYTGKERVVEAEGVRVSLQILEYGGHNRIMADVPVAVTILKGLGLIED